MKRRRREEMTRAEWEMLQNMSILLFFWSFFRDCVKNVFGGNKNEEIPRVRKDLKKDIIEPLLGEKYFHRSVRDQNLLRPSIKIEIIYLIFFKILINELVIHVLCTNYKE